AMLRLSAQPLPVAELLLAPCQNRFWLETPRIEHSIRIAHVSVRRPQPKDGIPCGEVLHRQRADFFQRHVRIWTSSSLRQVVTTILITPRHICYQHSKRSCRKWRRLGGDEFGFAPTFKLSEGTVNIAGTVHPCEQRTVTFRVAFGCVTNGKRFRQRPGRR